MQFKEKIAEKSFPCVGARASLQKNQMKGYQAGHLGCPRNDEHILEFLYDFIEEYRSSDDRVFHSAFIIFDGPAEITPKQFERLFWQRLQCLADKDAKYYGYDPRVSKDPSSSEFSFSLKEEAFFIVALYPGAARPARQFSFPVIVFNPHQQFQALRSQDRFDKMKRIIRHRDEQFSGSINPSLADYGKRSEVFQYSGHSHASSWKCPLHLKHGES